MVGLDGDMQHWTSQIFVILFLISNRVLEVLQLTILDTY
jgi:hypothetical protein